MATPPYGVLSTRTCIRAPLPRPALFTSIEIMHKEEFIKRLAKKHRSPQQFYRDALHEILEGIQEQLAQGKNVHFIGFDSFNTRVQKGEGITISRRSS